MAFAFCMHGIRTKISECIFSVNQAFPFYFTTKYMVLQHFDVFMTKTILTWPVTFVVDKLLWKYMKSMTVSLKFIYWKILFRFVNKRFIIFVLIKHLFILTYVFFRNCGPACVSSLSSSRGRSDVYQWQTTTIRSERDLWCF